jgi:hypothetical protein
LKLVSIFENVGVSLESEKREGRQAISISSEKLSYMISSHDGENGAEGCRICAISLSKPAAAFGFPQ